MKLTTDRQEKWENFTAWFWQIAGGVGLGFICLSIWILTWLMSLPKVGP